MPPAAETAASEDEMGYLDAIAYRPREEWTDSEGSDDMEVYMGEDSEEHPLANRRRWRVPPPREGDVRRIVCTLLLGVLSVAIIILIAIVAGLQASKLNKGGAGSPTSPPSAAGVEWWKKGVIYQCYPRSYQDSDGDGSGDIKGIISRVDYLSDIGINALWLNPIFRSPKRDNGYDISDYTAIDPLFGSLEQLQTLMYKLHNKSMHLLLDFVPNHTSDEHPWFVMSHQNKTNPKRDWYVWADGKEEGGPPNNWISVFGGPAWTLDDRTGQYYLHQFSSFQPDLNYANPEVVRAFEDVLRFWLDRGVDGFRIDAVAHLLEDPALHDEPVNPNRDPACNVTCYDHLVHTYTRNFQGIHNITRGWRKVLDSYSGQRFMVGEVYDPIDVVMSYYGDKMDEFHFPFNFFLLGNSNWTGLRVDEVVHLWLDNMPTGGWPNWVLGNHDNHRISSKAGGYLACALNVLLLTLPGTPTTYYGEEIGMTDVYVDQSQRKDLYGDRDMERTPMQWSSEENAGFTTSASPWLPLARNFSLVNVQSEWEDETSVLTLYARLTQMCSTFPAFHSTNYIPVVATADVLVYLRYTSSDPSRFLVAINFAEHAVDVEVVTSDALTPLPSHAEVYLSSFMNPSAGTMVDLSHFQLLGGEALILKWIH